MMQTRTDLKEQAYRDLGNGGVQLLFLYPLLAAVVGISSELWVEYRPAVYAEVIITFILGLIRHRLALKLKFAPAEELPGHRHRYCLLTLLMAISWSIYNTWIIAEYGRQWTGLLTLMVTLGLTAGATSNLVWDYALMQAYLFIMMLPATWAMASQADTPALLTAIIMLVYTFLLSQFGRRHASRFWNLSYALEDLRESRQQEGEMLSRWRSLVENAPDIILLVNRQGMIEFINRTVEQYQPADVIGQPFYSFLGEALKDEVTEYYNYVFNTGKPVNYEIETITLEGNNLGWYACRMGPLIRRGQVESVVVIATDITQRRQIEDQLRTSREQLRRLAIYQQAALEEERRHMAREVHDELGQQLTALKLDLAWLERRLEDSPFLERVESMNALVTNTMVTVRRISSRLRPPLLDELGLSPALDWLTQDVCGRAGLEYHLEINLNHYTPDQELTLALFRVCQEGLTNVVRHAQASRVELEIKCEGEELQVRISDNGVGIVADRVNTSLGLLGLRERVQGMGGWVEISGSPTQGSRILCHFPVKQLHSPGLGQE